MYQTLSQSVEETIFAKRSNLSVDIVFLTPANEHQANNCKDKTNIQALTASPKAMLLSVERPFVGAFAFR